MRIWVKPCAVPSSLISRGNPITDPSNKTVMTKNKRKRNAAFHVSAIIAAMRWPKSVRERKPKTPKPVPRRKSPRDKWLKASIMDHLELKEKAPEDRSKPRGNGVASGSAPASLDCACPLALLYSKPNKGIENVWPITTAACSTALKVSHWLFQVQRISLHLVSCLASAQPV